MAVFLNRNKRPTAAPIEVAEASLREAASLAYPRPFLPRHFAFGLKMIAARAPKKIAAAMPAEVEVRPPVKAPMKPIS